MCVKFHVLKGLTSLVSVKAVMTSLIKLLFIICEWLLQIGIVTEVVTIPSLVLKFTL